MAGVWERERVGRFGRMALKHVKYHLHPGGLARGVNAWQPAVLPALGSFHLVLGPLPCGVGGCRVVCAARALRRGPGLLSEPGSRSTLIAGAFLSIPARWPCTNCPPGRLSLDGLWSLPRETLTSPGQGKDILPSLGELAAAG